ncbi:elongation factor P hydroxylase [Microbulbifer magnicolonia]|uniref:elongation factor P hydroxylase n=1 Tax=Microbulbifer magnicolonia TaxID=3109744 RepID=UPI002B404C1D|nr:elongation factor P hydroxylase [Microbulbifer sp. GG15]
MSAPCLELAQTTAVEPLADRIAAVFDRCFATPRGLNTRLCGGHDEPFYRPAGKELRYHRVEFTRDYPASALHEAAHWCVAGAARRRLPDYGYWYAPDGRSDAQQAEFERVEVKPQALEWIFARACGLRFRASADNLESGLGPSAGFKRAIWRQVRDYCELGMNDRARRFARALALEFGRPDPLNPSLYNLAELA